MDVSRLILVAAIGSLALVYYLGTTVFDSNLIITDILAVPWKSHERPKSLAHKYYSNLAELGIGFEELKGFSEAAFNLVPKGEEEGMFYDIEPPRGLCLVCETVLGTFLKQVRALSVRLGRPKTEHFIAAVIRQGCKKFSGLRDELCKELGTVQSPMIFDVVSVLTVSETHVCSMLFSKVCTEKTTTMTDDPFQQLNPVTRKQAPLKATKRSSSSHVYFVHFTDLHLDPGYSAGSEADCPDPLCCRDPFKVAVRQPAGSVIGGLKCDSSPLLARNALQTMVNESFMMDALKEFDEKFDGKVEFVAFSGDIVPHDVWAEDRRKVESTLQDAFKLFQDVLIDDSFRKTAVPFYMALGNHEGAPVNSFPPKNINVSSNAWLYEMMEDNLRPWLHKSDTMRESGFYSSLRMNVRSGPERKDLKIITINSNFCYRLNWWLYVHFGDERDPDQMLEWLALELQDAKSRNEAVYILGHVPPGISDCFGGWSKSFVKLVNEYGEETVKGIFFGHTHTDQIQVFHNDIGIPSLVSWISPSVTPFESGVPAFRVFQADSATWEITNAFTFYAIGTSRHNNYKNQSTSKIDYSSAPVSWSLAYDFKSTFGVDRIDSVRVKGALDEILGNDDQFRKYFIETVMRGLSQEDAKHALNRCAKSAHRKTGNPVKDCRSQIISQSLVFEELGLESTRLPTKGL